MPLNSIEAAYSLSPIQHGMLFHSLYAPHSGVDIEQMVLGLPENLNIPAFERAWQRVIERYGVLRTSFRWEGLDEPCQEVHGQINLCLVQQDWRQLSAQEQQSRLAAYLQTDRQRGFELTEAPLMRLTLFHLGEAEYQCVWTFHHILLDGRSFSVILRDLFSFYEAFCQGQDLQLSPPRLYRDYIEWLHRQDPTRNEDFWRELLKGFTAPTPLTVDHLFESGSDQPEGHGEQEISLTAAVTSTLQALARDHHLTVNTFVQGAWALLLSRYSREEEVVFGATRACRHATVAGAESIVGLFINTLPLRLRVPPEMPLLAWLKDLRAQNLALREAGREHTPLVKVQEWSDVPRGLPLFESILVFENYHLNSLLQAQGSHWQNRDFRLLEQTNFPLTVNGYLDSELLLKIAYDKRRFDDGAISRMLGHLKTLLEGMAANPAHRLADLPLLTQAERRQLFEKGDGVSVAYRPHHCLHQLFEAQVNRNPQALAVVCDDEALTYQALNHRANQLAHYLQALGVGPDVLVAVYMDRSLEMVIALLAILKAGGAYVPLDPAYPPERLAFMLADTQAAVVLTQARLAGSLPAPKARVIRLDSDWERIARESVDNPLSPVSPDQLAYVIYTSGSTGQPKGVLVNHYNVVRLFEATQAWFRFDQNDVWTLFHSYAFDFSVWELWGALIYGGRLVVVPYWLSRSPEAFYRLLASEGVTVLNQTPSAFRQLIQAEGTAGVARDLALRLVIFGGEAFEPQSLKPWFERHGDRSPQLVNMYGITETTVHVTYRPLTAAEVNSALGSVIGVPIPDLQLYILDQQLQPVPIGVAGEMYVGGAGVARGYLHRPALTAERFIPNPFENEPDGRLYKSGDLARYLPNGDIEYLGRIDHQVKIRGFRIELGEIEAVLGRHPAVQEGAVLARADGPGEKRLVAYIVAQAGAVPAVMELRQFLKTRLPEYMIPAAFVTLDKFPLTANGKLDRRALPAPQAGRPDLAKRYVAPRTPVEELLAKIWAEVLRLERVGIHDNLFELGGDSILNIQIVARARRAGLQLSPHQLFQQPTIAELVEANLATPTRQSEQGLVQGSAPLTPIQHWFFEQDFPTYHHWNQAFLFTVEQKLNLVWLEQAIQQLMRHHDTLRLRFDRPGSDDQQSFAALAEPVPLTYLDLSSFPTSDQANAIAGAADEAQASLNLGTGPMLRVVYFNLGDGVPGRLLLVIHHLAVDGVSWRILMEDLESVYRALQHQTAVQLPSKTTSYKQWATLLTDYAQSAKLLEELAYWTEVTGVRVPPALPVDFNPAGLNSEASTCSISTSLEVKATQALLKQVPVAYNTQINDALLTALAQTITAWTGHNALFIDLEGHGREEVIEGLDLSRTVGWFTTVFPVRLDLDAAASPGQALTAVKEQLRRIPKRGIGYGVLRYRTTPAIANKLSTRPQPQVVFNYLGQVDQIVADSRMFAFAPEESGPAHSPMASRRYLIEIIGQVRHGQLVMTWLYSRHVHRAETIERLAREFMAALNALIAHCQSVEAPGYTPSDFPLANLDQPTLDRLLMTRPDLEDIHPLSPMQQLFYAIDASNPAVGFEQWHFTLHGELDIAAFKRAWERVVNRHAILRSAFIAEGLGEPHQITVRQVPLPWIQQDWRDLARAEQESRLEAFLQADKETGFDLMQAPLTRVALIQVSDTDFQLIWSTHHLQIDGWSWPLVFKDLSSFYTAFRQGQEIELEPSPAYRDYVAWLQNQDLVEAETFWRQTLKGLKAPTPLPGSPRPGATLNRPVTFGELEIRLSPAVVTDLQALARQHQITLGTLLQGAWAILLGAYSGLDEVVFGATFSGRPAELAGVESIVGPFVNNLPVRVRLDPEASLASWLKQLQARQLDLSRFQHTPLTKIQAWSEVPLRSRLFESLIVFQNYVVDESTLRLGDHIRLRSIASPHATNYPLTVMAIPGQELHLKIIYHADRFDPDTVADLLRHLQHGLEHIIAAQTQPLSYFLERKILKEDIGRDEAALLPAVNADPEVKTGLEVRPTYMPPQTEVEHTIASVWQQAFGLEKIGLYDNFLDLGGSSLMMVAVHSQLQHALGATFPITKMFQHSTVSALAHYLSQGPSNTPAYNQIHEQARRQREALIRAKQLKNRRS